jgi:hypothetical protein
MLISPGWKGRELESFVQRPFDLQRLGKNGSETLKLRRQYWHIVREIPARGFSRHGRTFTPFQNGQNHPEPVQRSGFSSIGSQIWGQVTMSD